MPWDSAGNYTPPGGWLGKTKAAGSDGDGGSKSTTTLRSDGSGWDESGNYTPPGGWLGKQKQDQQQKQQQQNESFANQAQQADAQRAQLEGQSFENVPEHTPGGGKFAALAPVTPNITDGRNWWDKTRDFVKSALTGDVRDQIGAALTEAGQGAIAGVPFAEQLTNRMVGDETGQTSKRIHEENAQLIGETATKAFHAAGMIGSMVMGGEVLAPVKGLQGLNLFNTAKTGQGMLRAALPALEETAAGRALNTAANAAIYGMGNEVVRGYTDPNAERNTLTDLGAGTRQGLADVGSGFGKAMTWASNPDQTGVLGTSARALGLDHLGKHLDAASQTYGEGFQRDFGTFGWKSFLNPNWYAYNVGRMLPFTVSMMPEGVLAAKTMGLATEAMGLAEKSPFLSHVLQSLAAGAATAPLEAAVEAGQVYEDVYKQGIAKISFDGGTPTKEQLQQIGHEANRASNKGFWLNTGVLAAFNAGEFATLFMPKGVSRLMDSPGGRIGFGAVNEGAQESAQQVIQNYAENKPLMDPSVIEQGVLGALFGGVMGAGGHVSAGQEHHEPQAQQQPKQGGKLKVEITPPTRKFAPTRSMSGIQDRTLAKLDPVDQADLNERLAEARTLGLPEAQVKQEALDALAQHPDGQQMIDEAVQEEMQSQANQQLASMTPEQMQAHADAMQQQHVMAEPDVPGNVPADVPGNVPVNVPGNGPGNVPADVPGNVPADVPVNVPGNVPGAAAQQTPVNEQHVQQAKDIIQQTGSASIATLLQHMKIDYTSAAKLIDQLETEGFIGPYDGSNGGRKVFGGQPAPTQQPQQQAPAPAPAPKAPAYKPAVGDKVRLKGRPDQTYTVQDASDRSMVVLDNGMKVGHAALEPVMNENEPDPLAGLSHDGQSYARLDGTRLHVGDRVSVTSQGELFTGTIQSFKTGSRAVIDTGDIIIEAHPVTLTQLESAAPPATTQQQPQVAPTVTDNAPAEVVQPEQKKSEAQSAPAGGDRFQQASRDFPLTSDPAQHQTVQDLVFAAQHELDLMKEEPAHFEHMSPKELNQLRHKLNQFINKYGKQQSQEQAAPPTPAPNATADSVQPQQADVANTPPVEENTGNQQAPGPQEQPKGGVTSGTADDVRTDGQGPLEETPAQNVPGSATERPTANGAAERPASDGASDGSNGAAANGEAANTQAGEPVGEGAAPSNDTGTGMGDGTGDVRPPANGTGSADANQSTDDEGRKRQERAPDNRRDFVITNELDDLGGAKTKFKGNMLALQTLRQIENESRLATAEEQATLAKYVGWGGLAQAFDEKHKGWQKEYQQLRALVDDGIITQQEYESMRQTTQYAHYTSPEVVGAMYKALERMGFTGGRVLEPSMGTGNFFGLMPAEMTGQSSRTGVEMDPLSGRIAKQLYQQANIQIKPFQDYGVADGYFDVAIGNPPFSDMTLTYGKGKGSKKLQLHNFFFMRSLDKVRDGGIVAFVTSSGTMNARTSANIRQMMLDKADFLGAVRLPSDAFKQSAGTEVTTDIIFFQKRANGQAANHAGGAGGFIQTVKQKATRDSDGKTFSVDNSKYFADHPAMVLGEYTVDRLTGTRLGVKSSSDMNSLKFRLNAAIDKLPQNIYTSRQREAAQEPVFADSFTRMDELDQGGYAIEGGKILQRMGDQMVEVEADATKRERIAAMIPLRDAARSLIRSMLDPITTDTQITAQQKRLNALYDAFVNKYGYLNDKANVAAFKADSIGAGLLMSLEVTGEKGKYTKEAIFEKRTIKPQSRAAAAGTAEEALGISLYETGRLDFSRMTELTGKAQSELVEDLAGKIYLNPATTVWEPSDEYLSGNVRQKLLSAQDAANRDPKYQANVAALEAVQPVDLTPGEISVKLGSSWLPTEDIEQFIAEFLDAEGQARVFYNRLLATWNIQEIPTSNLRRNTKNTDEYGVKHERARDKTSLDLIGDSLNQRATVVSWTEETADGKKITVVDEAASNQARMLQKQINDIFVDWLWSDEQRADRLTHKYNWELNAVLLREYDGELIYGKDTVLPGANTGIKLRKHQRDGVWRTVQGGNTLFAHVVGSGKTWTVITSAMEMKRLGLINKPLITVPNNLLDQWEKSFHELYPGAKILKLTNDDIPTVTTRKGQVAVTDVQGNPVFDIDGKPLKREMTNQEFANKRDQHRSERAAALSKIAVGSYDAVLITHETFGKLPMSPESVQAHIREQIEEVETAIRAAEAEGQVSRGENMNKMTIKQLEKMKEKLKERLKESLDEESRDVAIPFEELGIDQLYVDEAHKFKNLRFHTKMRNVAGLPKTESKRATDMYLKTRYLTKLRNGRGVVFATGTPISNTVAEMFTVWRYLLHDQMTDLGMAHFDAWAATFGETTSDFELNAAGQYKQKTRFSRFQNVPELMRIFKGAADIRTADMLDLPTPDNVEFETVVVAMSDDQRDYMRELLDRANGMKNVNPAVDNWLKLTGDGRKMALDIRLVRPDITQEYADGKIANAVGKMMEIYNNPDLAKDKDGNRVENATQLVFLDLGTPKAKSESDEEQAEEAESAANVSVYVDIKRQLIAGGVPAEEIAFIHEANTDKRKITLFDNMNKGEVRFLIGSTEKMGAGMNVQKKLVALHHIDAPWRPSDVEQREGRIIRQGNDNNTIYVYRYTTKGSFDQLMWETLKRKAFMINQVMNGTSELRTIEDVEAIVFRYAEVAAVTADNPLIMDKLKVDKEVNDLQGLKTQHERAVAKLKRELVDLPRNIERFNRIVAAKKADQAKADAVPDDKQVLTVDGVTYEKPKDEPAIEETAATLAGSDEKKKEPTYRELAGQQLINKYNVAMARLNHGESMVVGSFGGFDVVVRKGGIGNAFELRGQSEQLFEFNGASPTGQYSRLVNAFSHFKDSDVWWYESQSEAAAKRIEEIKPLANKPFAQEAGLRDAMARQGEIMRQLTTLNQANEQVSQDEGGENDTEEDYALAATPVGAGNARKPGGKGSRKMKNVVTAGIEETKNVLTPQVSGQISDMIAKALNTVVNEDFVKRGAQGVYSPYTKAAAVKGQSYFEWRVVGHELGHVFSDFYAPGKDRYSGQLPIKELQSLALALYPDPRAISKLPVKMQVEEGFAEFFRQWVADPLLAAKNAPQTAKMFESFIAADKELMSLFSTVRTLVDNDLQGTAVARAVQGIITSEFSDDNDLHGAQYKATGLRKAQFEYLDYTVPAKALMKAARKMGTQVKVDLAKLMAVVGDAHAKAKTTFESQAKDHEGRYLTGRVLETIYTDGVKIIGDAINWSTVKLATVDKEILFLFKQHKKLDAKKIFDAILIAKRIQERADNGFEKLPMPVEMADEIIDMAETRFPDALKFAEEYASQLSHVILEKLERAGILTPEARQRIEAGSKFYIPFYYDTKNASKSIMTGRTKGGRTNKVPVKRFKGKVAPILDPFQASMMKLTEVEQAIEYKRVINTIHQLAKTSGLGTFARIVPRPQQAIQLSTEQVMDRIIGKLDEDVDISGVMEDKALTFFLPAGLEKTEGKPVIMNMVDGKQHFIELAPDIFNMLMAIKPPQVEFFGRMLAQMARLTRYTALVTGTYIVNAAVRDQATALIQSKDPLKTVFWSQIHGAAAAMGLTAAQADKLYADYINSGGFSSAAVNVINSQVGHIFNESLLKMEAPGWNKLSLKNGKKVLAKVLHTPEEIIRFFEEMPRLAEFVTVWRKEVAALGYDPAEIHKLYLEKGTDALPAELQEEIERISVEASHAAAEVTVNFRIRGRSEALRKYTPTVPFLHGTAQGAYRTARVVRHPKEHAKGLAIGIPTLTLISLVAWLIMQQDDDDRKNLADMDSTTRDKYWIFPNPFVKGTYLHLGKPFDFALPVNVFERWLDQTYGGPGARKMTSDVYSSLLSTFTKTQLINSFLQVLIDLNANKTQLGGPIVPQSALGRPVAEQFGAATSETAKFVANLLAGKNPSSGISPYKMDYFIRQTFGRWGTFGMKLSDMALVFAKTGNVHEAGKAAKGTAGVEYAPIIGQLVTAQQEGSSRTVERFYSDLTTARTISNSANDRMTAQSTQVPPWATPKNLQLLYFKPAFEAIADAMAANRKAYDEAISKAETPTLRRKFVDQKDYLDKLAAGVLYGIEPAAPSEEAVISTQIAEQLKAELQAKAQQAIVKEQKRKGGATEQLDYLSNVLNHTYVPTK